MLRLDGAVKIRLVETDARHLLPSTEEEWQPHAPIDAVGIPDKRVVADGDGKEEEPAGLEQIEELTHRAQVARGVERVSEPSESVVDNAADGDGQVVGISALAGLRDGQRLKLRVIGRNRLKIDRRDTVHARREGNGLKPRLL